MDKGLQTDEKPYPEETSENVEASPNLPSGIASQAVVAEAANESKEQPMTIEQHGTEKSEPEGTISKAIEKPTETEPGTPHLHR